MPGFQTLYRSSHPKALEDSLIQEIISYKKANPLASLYVVVPNNYIGAHLRHEIAKIQSHINVYFETLDGLAKIALSNHPSFLRKKRLSHEMEIEKLRKISEKVFEGTEYASISTKRGFLANLQSLFHHLISEKLEVFPQINEKTKLYGKIFEEYLKLKSKYHQSLWSIELAANEKLEFRENVLIYGFSSFSKLEQTWLTNLAKKSSINIWVEIFSREEFQIPTLLWLDQVSNAIEDLSVVELETSVCVQPCYQIADESEWISQTILDRQKKNPTDFRRFGIFLNDFASQEIHIRKSLERHHIPYVSIQDVQISQSRLGQALKNIMLLIQSNWSRADWFGFLELFPFESNILREKGLPSSWSKISVEAGISSRKSHFFQRLENYFARNPSNNQSSFVEFQKDLFEEFSSFEKIIENREYTALIRAIESFVHRYANPQFIIQPILILLDELRYALSDVGTSMTWKDVRELILEKVGGSSYNEKIFETDGVFIAPFSLLNGLFFDTIFLPHMNEGKFPRPSSISFDLHAEEIQQIGKSARVKFESTQNALDMQSSLFESSHYHAKYLHLSFSQYSLPKEDELKPSFLLQKFSIEPIFEPAQPSPSVQSPNGLGEQVQKWIQQNESHTWSQFNAYLDPRYISKDVYSATELSTYAVCPRRYYFRHILGLSAEDYLEEQHQMMPKDKGTIVHEILFRFYLSLKTKGLLPVQKSEREQIGKILETVTNEVFDQRQISSSYGIPNLWDMERDRITQDLKEYVEKEIVDDSYWIPTSFEYRFGMKKFQDSEDDPDSFENPIELKLFRKSLKLKGKVDRIDFSADKKRLRVTDYKTGNLMERKSWGYDKGSNLQLPLYLLLSEGFFPGMNFDDVVGKLVSLQGMTKFDERILNQGDIQTVKDELYNHLELLDHGIKSGYFFPNPGPGAVHCRYCDYRSICGDHIDQIVDEIETTDFMKSYDESKKSLP